MTSTQGYSWDLAEEMIKRLEEEFGPEALRAELKAGGDKSTEALFAGFGRRWMERTLELGEQHSDRTYETLKAAAAKTGSLSFPFIPERFIEIAFLATQPIYTLPIVENGARGLVFKVPFCGYVKMIREELGDEEAALLPCKEACFAACRLAFERFGSKVTVGMDAAVPKDEFCQFSIRPA